MKHTTTISGDYKSIKELITKLDPIAGANFHRNCDCHHSYNHYTIEFSMDQNDQIFISKINTDYTKGYTK
jgi:hypothetical protein